jgi:hypothetical protein
MTLRDVLGPGVSALRDRLEQVLDGEDAIVILVDRTGTTTHYHGFGASGCQLELASGRVDTALREIAGEARCAPAHARAHGKEAIAG